MRFICETIDSTSSTLKGPLDSRNWPTVHPSLVFEGKNLEEALSYFEGKFPNNVEYVYSDEFLKKNISSYGEKMNEKYLDALEEKLAPQFEGHILEGQYFPAWPSKSKDE